jgi:hypothetical protein
MAVDQPASADQIAQFAAPPKDKAPAKKDSRPSFAPKPAEAKATNPSAPTTFQTSAADVASSTFGKRKQDAFDLIMSNTTSPAAPTAKITPAQINPDRFFTSDTAQIAQPAPVKAAAIASKKSDIDLARDTPEAALPVFVFKSLAQVPDLAKGIPFETYNAAKNMEESKLPAFTFKVNLTGKSLTDPAPAASTSTATAPAAAPVVAAPPVTGGFTGWGAGAFAKPKGADAGSWICSVCSCTSKAGSTKCDVCETPR